MIIAEIKDQKIEVPTTWEEVELGTFVEAYAKVKEAETKRDKVRFALDLCGISYRDFCRLGIEDQLKIMDATRFALEDVPDDGDENGFVFEGVRYSVPANWGSVSVAEWLDLDHYLNKFGTVRGIPYFLAVYFRPEGFEAYDSDKAAELAERLKGIKVPVAWGAANFFLRRAECL